MKISGVFIGGLLLFLFTACKKEPLTFDKEENLSVDTSMLIYRTKYLTHTSNEASFQIEIVQFNKLNSEQLYLDKNIYIDQGNDFVYTFSNFTEHVHTPIPDYSSVFLIERSDYGLFAHGQLSFYLKRYWEQLAGLAGDKKIALATYRSQVDSEFTFHKEGNLLFGNSATFNDSIMVDIIQKEPYFAENRDPDGIAFKNVMFQVMDSLIASSEVVGQKSITLFDNFQNNNNWYPFEIIDDIVEKAVLNNIQINAVCQWGEQFFDLASGTGGFVIDDRERYKLNQEYWDFDISAIGNNVANLDKLLSNNVTSFRFDVVQNLNGNGSFGPNSEAEYNLIYRDNTFSLRLEIP